MRRPRCDVGATRCFLSTFGAKSCKKCSRESSGTCVCPCPFSPMSWETALQWPKFLKMCDTSFFLCSLAFSNFLVWFSALQPPGIPVLFKIKRKGEWSVFCIFFKDFHTIAYLWMFRKYAIVRKSLTNIHNFVHSRFLFILNNTGISDGCNAENQTKKFEKASEH